jgi:hypothetical protein
MTKEKLTKRLDEKKSQGSHKKYSHRHNEHAFRHVVFTVLPSIINAFASDWAATCLFLDSFTLRIALGDFFCELSTLKQQRKFAIYITAIEVRWRILEWSRRQIFPNNQNNLRTSNRWEIPPKCKQIALKIAANSEYSNAVCTVNRNGAVEANDNRMIDWSANWTITSLLPLTVWTSVCGKWVTSWNFSYLKRELFVDLEELFLYFLFSYPEEAFERNEKRQKAARAQWQRLLHLLMSKTFPALNDKTENIFLRSRSRIDFYTKSIKFHFLSSHVKTLRNFISNCHRSSNWRRNIFWVSIISNKLSFNISQSNKSSLNINWTFLETQ